MLRSAGVIRTWHGLNLNGKRFSAGEDRGIDGVYSFNEAKEI